jgi:hypothetical protein
VRAEPGKKAEPYNFRGKSQRLSEWAKEYGVKYGTLASRLGRGWSFENTLEGRRGDSSKRDSSKRGQASINQGQSTSRKLSLLPEFSGKKNLVAHF